MEKMDKGLTVQKWVLTNWSKIPKMLQNLFTQIVHPSWKVWDFDEKRLFGASIVHAQKKKYSNLQVDRSLVFSPDQCQYYPKDNPAFSSPKWVKQQHTMQWFEKVSEEFNLFSGENGCGKIKNAPSKIFYPIA